MPKLVNLSPNRQTRRMRRSGASAVHLQSGATPEVEQAPTDPTGEVRRLPNVMAQAALLQWLGQAPITFHRAYVDIAGGVVPALWLSSAMERVARAHAAEFEVNGDFVFTQSSSECELVTGISRKQQAACRRELIAQGLISEQAQRSRVTVYRLHLDRIARRLMAQAAPLAESLATYEPLPTLPGAWARSA